MIALIQNSFINLKKLSNLNKLIYFKINYLINDYIINIF